MKNITLKNNVCLPALMVLLLSGCASWEPSYPDNRPAPPPNPWPVPTESSTPEPDTTGDEPAASDASSEPDQAPAQKDGSEPYEPVDPPRPTPPPKPYNRKPASVALANQASQQAGSGDLAGAAATLERALRIDRRDARLWQQLATVRMGQGRAGQAEALLKKSNALASGDTGLQSENWRYIAELRESQGDKAGAGQALDRSRELRAGG